MKVINRLLEIHRINKYYKYINNNLIPEVNKTLNLALKPALSADEYTIKYGTIRNEDNEFMDITLKFTTNHIDIDGIFWGTFIIAGRTTEIGSLTGDLKYDLDIIEDTYYDFYEYHEHKNIKLPSVKMGN